MEEKNNHIPENEELTNNQEESSVVEPALASGQEAAENAVENPTGETMEAGLADDNEKKEENPVNEGENPAAEAAREVDMEAESGEESIAKEFQQVADLEEKMSGILEEESEEEELHDEHEEDDKVDYEALSPEELIQALAKVLEEEDYNVYKNKVALIKSAFLKKILQLKESFDINQHHSEEDEEKQKKINLEQKERIRDLNNSFDGYFQLFKEKKKKYFEDLERQKQENLARKHSVLAAMKELLDSNAPLKEIDDDFNKLKDEFYAIGPVPKESLNDLWQTFHFYQERFFDKIKITKELRDLGLAKNLEKKIALCEQAEELLLEKSPQKAFKKLQELHNKWKEIGAVPSAKREELWERFKTATEKIHDLRHAYYEQLKEREEEFYQKKLELCEKIEETLKDVPTTFKGWNDLTEVVKGYFEEWRSLGRAPKEVNDQVWERFRTSLNSFYQLKKDFFSKIRREQKENLNKKIDICIQAEALQDSTDWKKTTKALIDLQKQWKTIGHVPKKHSDKVWKRFRAACDTFFNNKAKYFSSIDENQQENLKKKQALIEKLKSFEIGEDTKASIDALKEIQREWSEIGHVPFKQKDAIYNEYRNLLNGIYDALNISRKEIANQNFREKYAQLAESPHGKQDIQRERRFLTNKLRQMEDEIKVFENNLGFFSYSKGSQKMRETYEKKIEKAKKDLEGIKERIRILGDLL